MTPWICLKCETDNGAELSVCDVCGHERLYTHTEVAALLRAVRLTAGRREGKRRFAQPSYERALLLQLAGGLGLFYVGSSGVRRWLYPIAFLVALLMVVLGPVMEMDPFTGAFGANCFLIAMAVYLLGYADTIRACRARRRAVERLSGECSNKTALAQVVHDIDESA